MKCKLKKKDRVKNSVEAYAKKCTRCTCSCWNLWIFSNDLDMQAKNDNYNLWAKV